MQDKQLSHKAAKYFSELLQSGDKGVITEAACILVLSRHNQTYLHQCGLRVWVTVTLATVFQKRPMEM